MPEGIPEAAPVLVTIPDMDHLVREWNKNTSEAAQIPSVLERRKLALEWIAGQIRGELDLRVMTFPTPGSISFAGAEKELEIVQQRCGPDATRIEPKQKQNGQKQKAFHH